MDGPYPEPPIIMTQPRTTIPALLLALAATTACARSAQQAPAPQSPSVRVTTPAAPAAAQTTAAAVNPVGVYDFSTSAEGMEVTGTITIVAREGGYGGSVTTSATSGSTISSVTVRDSTVTVVTAGAEGEATLQFTVSGQSISGGWAMNGMQGTLNGRKRPG